MTKTYAQYEFLRNNGIAVGVSSDLVNQFTNEINRGRFTKHNNPDLKKLSPESIEGLNRTRYAHNLSPVYNDDRVTTGYSYIYARKDSNTPEGMNATVYVETANAGCIIAGFLRRLS